MPSLRTRRSTRVFVPKTGVAMPHAAAAGVSARTLRSGKRLSEPIGKRVNGGTDDWLTIFDPASDREADVRWWGGGRNGDAEEDFAGMAGAGCPAARVAEFLPEAGGNGIIAGGDLNGRMFGSVYSRKRRRSQEQASALVFTSDRRFGIFFSRKKKGKNKTVDHSSQGLGIQEGLQVLNGVSSGCSGSGTGEKPGISDIDYRGLDGPVVLVAIMKSSWNSYSNKFTLFLTSLISWMRGARIVFSEFVEFLLAGSLANAFSLGGVCFVALPHCKDYLLSRYPCGCCMIYGSREFVPLLSFNFSALPVYFKSMHLGIFLRSLYFNSVLFRFFPRPNECSALVVYKGGDRQVHPETKVVEDDVQAHVTFPAVSSEKHHEMPIDYETPERPRRYVLIRHSTKSRKNQRKRTSVRHAGVSSSSLLNLAGGLSVRPLETYNCDLYDLRKELNDVSSPLGSYHSHRKSNKRSPEKVRWLNDALGQVKQNIYSESCSANILLIETDRCRREEGASVMLEYSDSNELCIAVKVQGSTRYLHKPQEMRSSVVNRYTHAYIWNGSDSWKLEFCDRWDWLVFKLLHAECRSQNAENIIQEVPVTLIPIPGVKEVPDYEGNAAAAGSFARPESYIHIMGNEVERAMAGNVSHYDMDSTDEEWLNTLNDTFNEETDVSCSISEENFENIIFSLEKDTYSHPDKNMGKDKLLEVCEAYGKREMVAAVHDYWLRRRNKKRAGCASLVRIFQVPPVKRSQLVVKPFLRKKRSFKRQRSQTGRVRPEYFWEDAEEDGMRRVQEAESAASSALGYAIYLRNRAQKLMANADLAVYKAVMAFNICEALLVSESPDFASSICD